MAEKYVESGYVESGYIEGGSIIDAPVNTRLPIKFYIAGGGIATPEAIEGITNSLNGGVALLYAPNSGIMTLIGNKGHAFFGGSDINIADVVESQEFQQKVAQLAPVFNSSEFMQSQEFQQKVAQLAPVFNSDQFLESQEMQDKIIEVSPTFDADAFLQTDNFSARIFELAPNKNELSTIVLSDSDIQNNIVQQVINYAKNQTYQEALQPTIDEATRRILLGYPPTKVEIHATKDDPVVLMEFEVSPTENDHEFTIVVPQELVGENYALVVSKE